MTIPFILKDHNTYGSNGDDMLELQAVHDRLSLNGKVRCENCNTNMTNAFGIFSCTTAACPTPDISEDVLLTAVMSKLVDRITTDETLERVSQNIKETTNAQVLDQMLALRNGELPINIVDRSDSPEGSASGVIEQTIDLKEYHASLRREATLAREALDRLDFISDTEGIRDTAKALDTYLNSPEPEYVQELLDLVVDQVRLSETDAWVVYAQDLASQDDPGATPEDVITLP